MRKCIEKVTQKEYAVKIIDLTGEKDNSEQMEEIRIATRKEINSMRMCADHPHISKHLTVQSQAQKGKPALLCCFVDVENVFTQSDGCLTERRKALLACT